jgi:hypothetical protein
MSALTRTGLIGLGIAGASYGAYVAGAWLRYGRTKRPEDPVLDRFMPAYETSDHHETEIAAPVDVSFAAAKEMRMERSRIVRAIFRGRELFMRASPEPAATAPSRGIVEEVLALGWGILSEKPGEIVLGAICKPWQADPQFRALSPDGFSRFCEPGYVKIIWNVRVVPLTEGRSLFSTQTRAVATDPVSRARFRKYWSLVSPGIHLIRAAMLPIVKADAEHRAHPLPGDELLPDARTELTHSIDIDAPPSHVWPWLVQMGCRRAGWYSYDRLDNAGVRSAERIIPELQNLAVGDKLPMTPKGDDGFEVLRIDPERALILGSKSSDFEGTWAFVLEPLDRDRTRLVTRYRAAHAASPRMTWFVPWMRAVHAVMEGKQLRTIKHHAEHCN